MIEHRQRKRNRAILCVIAGLALGVTIAFGMKEQETPITTEPINTQPINTQRDIEAAIREQETKQGEIQTRVKKICKPIIYFYPKEQTDVIVRIDYNGKLTYTYPQYNDGWNVVASPDSTLINHADGREYSYLFWEGDSNIDFDFSNGFVVKGSGTVAFLQEKLAHLGLTPREYNEFIVYWLPQMQDNPYNLIAFQGAAYTDNAKLIIEPKPDSVLRVFMAFVPLQYPINIAPQELEIFERKGFTVVEWGGTQVARCFLDEAQAPPGRRKPVLYLYPERKTDVVAKLDIKGKLTYTYPQYEDVWSVTASPDSTLIDHADGREYSYLFWEGDSNIDFDFSKGFVVKGSDTVVFLQEKLAHLGLTPREYNEFIVYWLPQMQDNPYNLIAFQGKAYTDNAKLTITPKPDSVLRVFMAFKPLKYRVDIPPQELKTFERKGFTVVEWGGTQVHWQ